MKSSTVNRGITNNVKVTMTERSGRQRTTKQNLMKAANNVQAGGNDGDGDVGGTDRAEYLQEVVWCAAGYMWLSSPGGWVKLQE